MKSLKIPSLAALLMHFLSFLLLSIGGTVGLETAKAEAIEQEQVALCRLAKSVRIVSLKKTSLGWKVLYSKEGVESSQGEGQYFQTSLEIFSNIQKNLESGGWACKTVKNHQTSDLTPILQIKDIEKKNPKKL